MKVLVNKSDGKIVSAFLSMSGDEMDVTAKDGQMLYSFLDNLDVYNSPDKFFVEDGIIRKRRSYFLEIVAGLVDTDNDGILDIPADGKFQCCLTVLKKDSETKELQELDQDEIFISTSAGALSEIFAHLEHGQFSFSLTASFDTVIARIAVKSKSTDVVPGVMEIQFRPVESKRS